MVREHRDEYPSQWAAIESLPYLFLLLFMPTMNFLFGLVDLTIRTPSKTNRRSCYSPGARVE
jgi:hypothetical protein